jgi:hypothetical protein
MNLQPKQKRSTRVGDPNASNLQTRLRIRKLYRKVFCIDARRCLVDERDPRGVKNFGAIDKVKVIAGHDG